jgi:hypothetical protein
MPTMTIYAMPRVLNLLTGVPGYGASMQYGSQQLRPDFTIFRGVKNDIEVLVRDIDRHPVVIGNSETFSITISKIKEHTLVLRKDLTIVDATKGRYRFSLSAIESSTFVLDSYRFVATRNNIDGESMLFTDLVNQPDSIMWVTDGPVGIPQGATVVPLSSFTPRDGKLFAGSYAAVDVHTVMISLSNFTGKFFIEVSASMIQPQIDAEWSVLNQTTITAPTSGVQTIVVNTDEYLWVRFRLEISTGIFTSASYSA